MRPLKLIVAFDRNRLIGAENTLPWNYPEDLRHFREKTMGHVILMGRKTFESIGRPLAGRENFILSASGFEGPEGTRTFRDLDAALEAAYAIDPEPFIIGGASLYEKALPQVTELILTQIDAEYEGDAYFPEIPRDFVEVERQKGEDPALSFVTLRRSAGLTS
ncbi:MAG: dihydrofolate reductase [Sandaracinaceae bacterium]|nr:dihydrofolate reductase [Sandaracinaceae bacterium]